MSNKKKNPKKKINPAVLAKLKLGFSTLVSNDAVIDAGRNWKGKLGTILPITLAIVSVIIAVIPGLVSRLNADYGSSLLGSPSYSYDVGVTQFTDALAKNSAHVEIENGTIKVSNWSAAANYTNTATGTTWYQCKSSALDDEIVFEAFVNTKEAMGGRDVDDSVFFANILNNRDPGTGDSVDGRTRKGTDTVAYQTNAVAFGKEGVLFVKYSLTSTTAASKFTGSYASLNGTDIAKFSQVDTSKGYTRITATTEMWKGFVRTSMESSKVSGAWSYNGIIAAVYTGLIALFGFIIWLMCRGKNNPFRIYTIWECEKMAYWAAFAPAVLSLILGFMLPTYQLFFFIFLFGMRLMWMSMKSLRPMAPTK